MKSELEILRDELIEGLKRTLQGSYKRRAPAKKSVPFLEKSKKNLEKFLCKNSENIEARRFLSLAEEALLNYEAALNALVKAIELSPKKNRKDLSRKVQLIESGQLWKDVKLSAVELNKLGQFLDRKLQNYNCDHTLKFTEIWLTKNQKKKINSILEGLLEQGGFCDCQVLNNVVD